MQLPMSDREFAIWLKTLELTLPAAIQRPTSVSDEAIADAVGKMCNMMVTRFRQSLEVTLGAVKMKPKE